jgi:hypothetical protein
MWLSCIAIVVTGALAYFGFSLAGQSSRSSAFRWHTGSSLTTSMANQVSSLAAAFLVAPEFLAR